MILNNKSPTKNYRHSGLKRETKEEMRIIAAAKIYGYLYKLLLNEQTISSMGKIIRKFSYLRGIIH